MPLAALPEKRLLQQADPVAVGRKLLELSPSPSRYRRKHSKIDYDLPSPSGSSPAPSPWPVQSAHSVTPTKKVIGGPRTPPSIGNIGSQLPNTSDVSLSDPSVTGSPGSNRSSGSFEVDSISESNIDALASSPGSARSSRSFMETSRGSIETIVDSNIDPTFFNKAGLMKQISCLNEEVERTEEILATTQKEANHLRSNCLELKEQLEKEKAKNENLKRKLYDARKATENSEFICTIFVKAYKYAMEKLATEQATNITRTALLSTQNEDLTTTCAQLEQRKEHLMSLNSSQQVTIEALQSDLAEGAKERHLLEDKNAELSLLCDELETTCESLEGNIRQMQTREEELEIVLEDTREGFLEMQTMVSELQGAYSELRSTVLRPDSASTSETDDDERAIDRPRPSASTSLLSILDQFSSLPPIRLAEFDTNDPAQVANQIFKLENLITTVNDLLVRLSYDREEVEDRLANLQERELAYELRLGDYIEIELDLKNREDEYFVNCERREREFNDLAREYERWRVDCEVREEDVRDDRACLWRLKDDVSKREREIRRKERELKWRVKCLGKLENGCWKCTPETSYTEDEDEECYDDAYESDYDNEEEQEHVSTNPSEEDHDEMIAKKVQAMMAAADERRRQKQRTAAVALEHEEELYEDFDEEHAKLNVDGLHGLGLDFGSPSQPPAPLTPEEDDYDDGDDEDEEEQEPDILAMSWDIVERG